MTEGDAKFLCRRKDDAVDALDSGGKRGESMLPVSSS